MRPVHSNIFELCVSGENVVFKDWDLQGHNIRIPYARPVVARNPVEELDRTARLTGGFVDVVATRERLAFGNNLQLLTVDSYSVVIRVSVVTCRNCACVPKFIHPELKQLYGLPADRYPFPSMTEGGFNQLLFLVNVVDPRWVGRG